VYWKDSSNTIRNFSLVAGVPASPSFTGNSTFTASSGVPVVITNTGTDLSFRVNDESGDTSPFVVDAAGNVGIGLTAPRRKLSISGGGFAFEEAGGTSRAIHWGDSTTGVMPVLIQGDSLSTGGFLAFQTNTFGNAGVERMRIDSTGVVDVKANAGSITHKLQYNEDGGEILLYDNAQAAATLLDQSSNQTRLLELINGSSLLVGLGGSNTTGSIHFMRAGYVIAATIDSAGNFGLGTQTVSSGMKMDVRGAALFYRTTSDGLVIAQGLQTSSGGTGKAAIQIDVNGQGGFAWQCDATGTKTLRLINNGGYGASETTLLTVTSAGVLAVGGNTVLHAGNYTSYSPTLTGTGASGTWGISVTGESRSVNLGGTGHTITSNAWAGTSGYHGYTHNGGNYRFGFSSTGGVVDVYCDGNFYATDSAHLVLHAGNYNNYAPTKGGIGATGTWAISITGTADYCKYQTGIGTANNFNTHFTETPAHGTLFREMSAGGPQGAWWFVENMRHSNGTNYWGRQNAWGWEDNANEFWSRNVTANSWGSWVRFIHSGNYNSYAPTLTGGGASGTWGINVSGTANSETLSTVCARGASTSNNITTTGAVYSSNWFRSNGATGWYNEAYGGGIWMNDATYVRVYGGKQFYADAAISSGTALYAPIFYDNNDTAWYVDPNGTSRCNLFYGQSIVNFGTDFYVGEGTNYSNIRMRDADEGERVIHCNSNRIGFLSQAGGWGSWCNDDGSWSAYGGTGEALEAIGGWGVYGCTIEVRTDGNGLQDGPRVWHHKGSAKWWATGIQGGSSNGYAIWEDGGNTQWGTERLVIAPGGNITHNGVPGYFVRAWAYFYNANRYGSGNVSSITSRSATGKYRINFETPLPSGNPCCLGNVGNESDTIANTTMRMGVRSFASGARLATQDINIVISGGQGVPAASDAMIGCSFLAII
jgi:hypothetical protein